MNTHAPSVVDVPQSSGVGLSESCDCTFAGDGVEVGCECTITNGAAFGVLCQIMYMHIVAMLGCLPHLGHVCACVCYAVWWRTR